MKTNCLPAESKFSLWTATKTILALFEREWMKPRVDRCILQELFDGEEPAAPRETAAWSGRSVRPRWPRRP
ncbi:MAG: hypothetical protein BWZ10_00331 [candidate division BRC1 bacterium ADurb.BinA364]|nr:MAG: hypothetical protein BWZ10_00331 [candidate division BRC1 bacterium ADurb.BinA364]